MAKLFHDFFLMELSFPENKNCRGKAVLNIVLIVFDDLVYGMISFSLKTK